MKTKSKLYQLVTYYFVHYVSTLCFMNVHSQYLPGDKSTNINYDLYIYYATIKICVMMTLVSCDNRQSDSLPPAVICPLLLQYILCVLRKAILFTVRNYKSCNVTKISDGRITCSVLTQILYCVLACTVPTVYK